MAWKRKKTDGSESGEPGESFDAERAAEERRQAMGDEGEMSEFSQRRALETELEGMRTLLSQKESLLLRAHDRLAEQENEIERIKTRLQLEADQKVETRVAAVIDEVLDVGDDLARAIMSAKRIDHNPDVIAGIELVRQSFGKRLQKLGVTRMQALGARFDPKLHEAISMMSVDDPAQDGVILAVVREGYALHGKVLREARVAVGKLALPR